MTQKLKDVGLIILHSIPILRGSGTKTSPFECRESVAFYGEIIVLIDIDFSSRVHGV